jgi:hypothetical protein
MNVIITIILVVSLVIDVKALNDITVPFKITLLTLGVITLAAITAPCRTSICLTEYLGPNWTYTFVFLFLSAIITTYGLHKYAYPKVSEMAATFSIMYRNAQSQRKEEEILQEMDEPSEEVSNNTDEEVPDK